MRWSVSVTGVCGVIHEVATPPEVVRVVLEVPPAAVDELRVVIQPEAVTDPGELVQAVQHLRALLGCRAIGTPQHTCRKSMNRIREPAAVAGVARSIIGLRVGCHVPLLLTKVRMEPGLSPRQRVTQSADVGPELDIEPEFDDVAVPHDIVLALDAGLARGADGGH